MVEIEKPRIECVENPGDTSYGKYVVEPLERGYGTTLGNSLRRILPLGNIDHRSILAHQALKLDGGAALFPHLDHVIHLN